MSFLHRFAIGDETSPAMVDILLMTDQRSLAGESPPVTFAEPAVPEHAVPGDAEE